MVETIMGVRNTVEGMIVSQFSEATLNSEIIEEFQGEEFPSLMVFVLNSGLRELRKRIQDRKSENIFQLQEEQKRLFLLNDKVEKIKPCIWDSVCTFLAKKGYKDNLFIGYNLREFTRNGQLLTVSVFQDVSIQPDRIVVSFNFRKIK